MTKSISKLLIIFGLIVMAVFCMSGYMSVQGPAYAKEENAVALLSFIAIVVGIILLVLSGDNKK